MSSFKLKLNYPTINYDWYEVNDDGTAKCPAYWTITGDDAERYLQDDDDLWYIVLSADEAVKIPFKTVSINNITTRNLVFSEYSAYAPTAMYIRVWFNETDYVDETLITAGTTTHEHTIEIPSNTEYIKIENISTISFNFYVDIDIEIETSENDINTELGNFDIGMNHSISKTIDGTLISTKITPNIVSYANEIILEPEQETEINELVRLAKLNKFLVLILINTYETAGNSIAGIGSGGAENWNTFYYSGHKRTQKTGLYSHIAITYQSDVKESLVYI